MPIYPVINTKTGEKQELNLTIAKYEQWRKDNPDWDKDWMAGVASEMELPLLRLSPMVCLRHK